MTPNIDSFIGRLYVFGNKVSSGNPAHFFTEVFSALLLKTSHNKQEIWRVH